MNTKEVRQFTSVCQEDLPDKPVRLSLEQVAFIREMVNDELDEIEEALSDASLPLTDVITAQYDGLVDAHYYLLDFAVRNGMNTDDVFKPVHAANMRKIVDGNVIRNDAGKVLKPEGWYPPDEEVKQVVINHLEKGSW